MHTVFVYGTLKTGERNHFLLEKDTCKFLGKGKTAERYPLVVATVYNIPFLLFKPGVGQNVKVELYEVDEDGLKMLDDLEMCPRLYERFTIEITQTDEIDGKENESDTVEAICYFLVKYRSTLLDLPRFESYSRYNEGCELRLPENLQEEDEEIKGRHLDWSEVHADFH